VPRYAILRHDPPPGSDRPVHWDFMLEEAEALKTWSLERAPAHDTAIRAKQLPDHRKAYLTYEGPVSENRGSVTRCDAGSYFIERSDNREMVVRLAEGSLAGIARIVRCESGDEGWLLEFIATAPDVSTPETGETRA
jgi:hypothetical protein